MSTEDEFDAHERRVLKALADTLQVEDAALVRDLLRETEYNRRMRLTIAKYGAWFGGMVITALATKDGIIWAIKKIALMWS